MRINYEILSENGEFGGKTMNILKSINNTEKCPIQKSIYDIWIKNSDIHFMHNN